MIYDQIQSGKGIKDDHMVPLGLVKESCGPAIMMEPFLKQVNGHVVCCLYCGDGFYEANSDEVSRKLCAMVEKITGQKMSGLVRNYLIFILLYLLYYNYSPSISHCIHIWNIDVWCSAKAGK